MRTWLQTFFARQGYWTHVGYKVELSRADKRVLDNPTMPHPVVDVLAYKPSTNTLLWVECKSYLDSRGLGMDTLEKIKVLADERYRLLVAERLLDQLETEGLVQPGVETRYALVAGNIHSTHRSDVVGHFAANGWELYDETWLKENCWPWPTLVT